MVAWSTPSAGPGASAAPTPSAAAATPRATRTPRGWLDPVAVHEVEANDCGDLTAGYSPRGDIVLVMACDDDIHVTHGPMQDGLWANEIIEHPPGVVLRDPHVAIDGDRLHVAASALAVEEGGCGDPGLRDTGVLVWSRTLPDGDWGRPIAVGGPDDHLQSFRVVEGVIHATVEDRGTVAYVRGSAGSTRRTTIPEAHQTSLRVGSDGVARIAYTTGSDVRLVTMRDGPLRPEIIHRGQELDPDVGVGYGPFYPSLVLAGGNEPIIAWTVTWWPGGGCADGGPPTGSGTYVFSDVGGVAATDRLSTSEDPASLTLDIPGGMAYVVITDWIDDQRQTNLYSRPIAGGDWRVTSLEGEPNWPIMRVDQDSGAAFLAWLDWHDDDMTRLMLMLGQVR